MPERRLRVAGLALVGAVSGLAGYGGGELLLAFFANRAVLNFYGFVPIAAGRLGNNRDAPLGALALGMFQYGADFLPSGVFSASSRSVRRVVGQGLRTGRAAKARAGRG